MDDFKNSTLSNFDLTLSICRRGLLHHYQQTLPILQTEIRNEANIIQASGPWVHKTHCEKKTYKM